jgi:hypothetical protein
MDPGAGFESFTRVANDGMRADNIMEVRSSLTDGSLPFGTGGQSGVLSHLAECFYLTVK